MKIDLYTKIVLTVIGAALCALAWQGASPDVEAAVQVDGCGSYSNPCYIEGDVDVVVRFGDSLRIRD